MELYGDSIVKRSLGPALRKGFAGRKDQFRLRISIRALNTLIRIASGQYGGCIGIDHVLQVDYLDEIGNGNGAFDVGDFRAWLQFTGMLGSIRQGSGEEVAP
jgi:hypothetical protein